MRLLVRSIHSASLLLTLAISWLWGSAARSLQPSPRGPADTQGGDLDALIALQQAAFQEEQNALKVISRQQVVLAAQDDALEQELSPVTAQADMSQQQQQQHQLVAPASPQNRELASSVSKRMHPKQRLRPPPRNVPLRRLAAAPSLNGTVAKYMNATGLRVVQEPLAAVMRGRVEAVLRDVTGAAPLDAKGSSTVKLKVNLPWYEVLLGIVIYIAIVLLASYAYGACFTYPYPPLRLAPTEISQEHFAFGLFDGLRCDPDWRICCCSCFCMPIRWADTVGSPQVGWIGFFEGVLAFIALQAVAGMTWVGSLLLLILALFGRQKIRAAYGLPSGDIKSILSDAAVWCCCAPCATMQEAMQIEFVERQSKVEEGAQP